MVEAAQPESRADTRARLKTKFVQIFETMDQHELKITEDGGNIEVRQSWDAENNVMIVFGEQKLIEGMVPDDFRTFYENWDTVGAEANDTLELVEKVGSDEGVDTMKCIASTPWPLSNRVMFSTRYLEFDVDGAHMMLFSGDGNQRFIDDESILSA